MKFWTPMLQSTARLLIVTLLPISINVEIERGELQRIFYYCIVSNILTPDSLNSLESLGFVNFLLGSLFLITAPLMYFEYRTRSIHPDNSVLPSATVLSLVSGALFIVLKSSIGSTRPYIWILYDVEIAFTWSIFVFLVFPILVRETKLLENHMTKGEPKPAKSRFRPSRYKILGYILGIVVAIGPYHFETSSFNERTYTILVSHSIIFDQTAYRETITGHIFENRIWFFTHNYLLGYALELSLLVSLGFCIFLLRYFKGNAKKLAIILTGLFGAFVPYIYSVIMQSDSFHLPTPFLLLTGLILMKKIPVVKADESVWDETPDRLWYEKPKVMEEELMVSVKVPIRYVLRSRLRMRGLKDIPSRSDKKSEKAAIEES